MPAASQRRGVCPNTMRFTIGPPGNRTAAEAKINRIAARPAAGLWGERADLFGGAQARAGEGGSRGARQGVFRRRRDGEGSRRPGFGAAVCPDGDRDGGLLDFGNRHRSCGQEAEHNADATGNAATAVLPAPDAPRADVEQLSDVALCDAECAEGRAEFGCGR